MIRKSNCYVDGQRPPSTTWGDIYFIEAVGAGFIKIGWTQGAVSKRMKDLQCASPFELVALGAMAGTLKDERALHRRFAALHVRGEWFRATDELRLFVKQNKYNWRATG